MKNIGAATLALALPWMTASVAAIFYRLPYQLVFIILGILGFGVAIWALFIIFHTPNTKMPPRNNSDDIEPV